MAARGFQITAERVGLIGRRERADVDAIPRAALTKFGTTNDRITAAEHAPVPDRTRGASSSAIREFCITEPERQNGWRLIG